MKQYDEIMHLFMGDLNISNERMQKVYLWCSKISFCLFETIAFKIENCSFLIKNIQTICISQIKAKMPTYIVESLILLRKVIVDCIIYLGCTFEEIEWKTKRNNI